MKQADFTRYRWIAGRASLAMLAVTHLMGCAASRLMMRHGDLQTKTEVRESIFLDLRSHLPRTVYISEGSTLTRELTIRPALERYLTESAYTVVESPDDATYLMQINHLSLLEFDLSDDQTVSDAITSAMAAGAGAALAADVLGAGGRAVGAVGLAVGVIGFVADAETKHIAHTLTTDVRITETVPDSGGGAGVRYHETRIVTGASKVNLGLDESLPSMTNDMGRVLSGLLPAPNTGTPPGSEPPRTPVA